MDHTNHSNTKCKRKDFRATEEELNLLTAHCTNIGMNHSDFIRAAITEKIAHDQTPTIMSTCESQLYNFMVRQSRKSPTAQKLLNDFIEEVKNNEK